MCDIVTALPLTYIHCHPQSEGKCLGRYGISPHFAGKEGIQAAICPPQITELQTAIISVAVSILLGTHQCSVYTLSAGACVKLNGKTSLPEPYH